MECQVQFQKLPKNFFLLTFMEITQNKTLNKFEISVKIGDHI